MKRIVGKEDTWKTRPSSASIMPPFPLLLTLPPPPFPYKPLFHSPLAPRKCCAPILSPPQNSFPPHTTRRRRHSPLILSIPHVGALAYRSPAPVRRSFRRMQPGGSPAATTSPRQARPVTNRTLLRTTAGDTPLSLYSLSFCSLSLVLCPLSAGFFLRFLEL